MVACNAEGDAVTRASAPSIDTKRPNPLIWSVQGTEPGSDGGCSSVAPNIPNESFAALVKKCAVGTLRLCNHSKTPGSVGFPGVPLIQKAIRSAIFLSNFRT